jgi:hypothetical protein
LIPAQGTESTVSPPYNDKNYGLWISGHLDEMISMNKSAISLAAIYRLHSQWDEGMLVKEITYRWLTNSFKLLTVLKTNNCFFLCKITLFIYKCLFLNVFFPSAKKFIKANMKQRRKNLGKFKKNYDTAQHLNLQLMVLNQHV